MNICGILIHVIKNGGLTLLSAFLAAGIALYIAAKIYPKQKEVDKRAAVQAELRKNYIDFLSSCYKLMWDVIDEKDNDNLDGNENYRAAFMSLQPIKLYGDSESIAASERLILYIKDYNEKNIHRKSVKKHEDPMKYFYDNGNVNFALSASKEDLLCQFTIFSDAVRKAHEERLSGKKLNDTLIRFYLKRLSKSA